MKRFYKSSSHHRAYGNVARLLDKYVREEKIISLEEAVYKLSLLPATYLKIKKRGSLKVGNYADVVLFEANTISYHATLENPLQYATVVKHVLINGGCIE